MKEIYSKIYINRSINFRGNTISFNDKGVAKVNDEVYKGIEEANLPQIATKKNEAKGVKTSNEKDADETIEVLKQEYLKEIDHLKSIIAGKDKKIQQLEEERDAWKNEAVKVLQKEEKTDNTEKESEDDLLKDLKEMPLEELVDLAKDEGVELTNKEDKDVVVNELIAFYKNKQ